MQPRWYTQAYTLRSDLHFLGGVGRFDLWLYDKCDGSPRIRLVTGKGTDYWDTIEFIGPNNTWPRCRYNEDKVKPNLSEYRMILRFVRLFAGLPLRKFET